jgi:hypothetical protein
MKTQELISSGKLELYVAGTLSEREMGDVAAYARAFPEVALEIELIEHAVLDFLSPAAFAMSDAEKERQIQQILDTIHDQAANGKAPLVPMFGPGRTAAAAVPMFRANTWAMAAITIGLVLMTGTSIWLGLRNEGMQQEMASLQENQDKLASTNQAFQTHYEKMQQQLTVMRNILTKRVELTTVAGNKITNSDNYMLVYWNPGSKKLMLADADLPELTQDQQYQLWALYDGKPVDAGVFDYKDKAISVGFQKDISNAQAFAVTVEPKGGSKTPTLGNLCMMAKL